MMRGMRWVLVCAVVACGPTSYIGQVTIGADNAVERARLAHADKYSPYWWTRANQFLHMAREVAAHADFQGAKHFGRLAEDAAHEALREAEIGAKDPSKLPYIDLSHDQTKTAPAKDKDGKDDKGTTIAPAKEAP
jgi:hypothetical protein